MSVNESNFIGKSVIRFDAYDKATGKANFVEDYQSQFKDLLHIKVLRSPYAHARILSIDTKKAEQLPGVATVAVGSDDDVPWYFIPYASSYYGNPAKDEVIWAGQAVAAVAAESIEIAEQALELIEVQYEELPYVIDQEEAMGPDAIPVLDPKLGLTPGYQGVQKEGPNVLGSYKLTVGDVDTAFQEADIIVEEKYSNDKKTASQIECNSAIVEYNTDGGVTIHTNCCGTHGVVKDKICTMFSSLPSSKVRVIQPYQGGSFGNRLFPLIEPLAVLMALRTKRNVSYILTRKEMYTSSPSNWPCVTKLKLGAKKDGTLIAEQFELVENTGASINNVYDGRLSGSGLVCVYRVPNVFGDGYAVSTNTMPCAPYRGLGVPESAWAMENLLDVLAEKLNMSPVELRLKNFLKKGEENAYGEKLTSTSVASCLKLVADAIKVDEPCEQEPGSPWRKGRGVAIGGKQNTPLGRSEADVLVHSDGSIELLLSVDEQGMGVQTTLAQMAATEFQVPVESIKITRSDSGRTPYDNFGASSRTTYTAGNAVIIACQDAIAQLKEAAGRRVGVAAKQVTIKNGKAYIVGSNIEELDIADLFEPFSFFTQQNWGLQKGTPVRGRGVYCPAPSVPWSGPGHEDGRTPRMWNWYQFSAFGAEIAVNMETGQIKLLRLVSAADTGNPINPKLVECQIDGGVIMALGFSTMDGHIYQDGKFINSSMSDYRLPTVMDTPLQKDFKRIISPDPLPDGPYGAKGMAESITIPVGPAIAAAVYKAVGVRPTVMPMTAERILALIKEKEAAK